jgi:hypothetical protein
MLNYNARTNFNKHKTKYIVYRQTTLIHSNKTIEITQFSEEFELR